MVSIKNIAEECGVSIATVSKALNNHSDVSKATKQLVCDTAKRMGYMPNAQARSLKTNRTYNIGVLLDDKAESGLTHSYFSSVLESFRTEAKELGYDITFICGQIGNNVMSYYEHCMYRRVDGVLVACVDFYDKEVIELIDSDIPTVSIDYISDNNYSVSSDNISGIRQIVEYAYKCGHKKIAFIYGESSQVTTTRLNSYLDTMKRLGLQVEPDYLKQARYLDAVGVEMITAEMLKLYDPPTCIILPDDFSSVGAMNAIDEAGLKIPGDISIVGYDGIKMTQMMKPCLTTIRQNTSEIGRRAAQLLVKLIRKEEVSAENRQLIISGMLLEGGTVCKL